VSSVAGSGKWITTSESMSDAAKSYQSLITGKPANSSYLLNGVKFDGYNNGILIDTKSKGYRNFINPNSGEFQDWFKNSSTGGKGLVEQGRRQVAASGGAKIQWYFEDQVSLEATKKLLVDEGFPIEYIHRPQ
jgi:hypothetical protein